MAIKEVLDFLTANRVFYLATSEGGNPRVRPMGFVMEWDGRLAFCTSNQKNMYKQLVGNPNMEISCADTEGNTLRISGKAVFVTAAETQKKALEVMPMLGNMYSVGDGRFEIFCLDGARAVRSAMSGETKVLLG